MGVRVTLARTGSRCPYSQTEIKVYGHVHVWREAGDLEACIYVKDEEDANKTLIHERKVRRD